MGHKPSQGTLPKAIPRLCEEILHLRLMADELQAVFYLSTLPPTADTTPATSTPQPAAPVGVATPNPTYASAAKAAIPPTPERPAPTRPTKRPQQKPPTRQGTPTPGHFPFCAPSLNEALNGTSKVKAVNRSRGGNLILHTQAPSTAVQLREHEQTIWTVVRPYFTLLERDRPRLHLDKPWQRVVIHRVPVTEAAPARLLVEELRWSNEGVEALADVMGVRDLCSFEGLQKRKEGLRQGVPQETSLLVMLLNADVVHRFLREGVFLYGSHCRVSVYDPKKVELEEATFTFLLPASPPANSSSLPNPSSSLPNPSTATLYKLLF
ncbi:hypothetical protein B0H10DRAFT_1944799 [Mycena sp. CBHHK59/15]|nr:hypothetical protein B0H10DRAFT_1944799 [Mycena sp. CBHHK59/15]